MQNERPILFSSPMVRAIVEGRKSQTRRIVKLPPDVGIEKITLTRMQGGYREGTRPIFGDEAEPNAFSVKGRFQVGQRLWVRETWADNFSSHVSHQGILYRATASEDRNHHGQWAREVERQWVDFYERPFKWRPSIFMPRALSRITLEVTGARIERVQAISESDAKAEGMDWAEPEDDQDGAPDAGQHRTFRATFQHKWEELHGRESWQANPFVWVVGFQRVPNERSEHGSSQG